jgi:hypothetical protein
MSRGLYVMHLVPHISYSEVLMSNQLLIPVQDVHDADHAIRRIPHVAQPGDTVVILAVSRIPEAEVLDTHQPTSGPIDMPQMGYQATTSPDDAPSFISSEELMEMKGQEICESLQSRIGRLHEGGYDARVDAVFSDKPAQTIREYAADLESTAVYVTSSFHHKLHDEGEHVAAILPD